MKRALLVAVLACAAGIAAWQIVRAPATTMNPAQPSAEPLAIAPVGREGEPDSIAPPTALDREVEATSAPLRETLPAPIEQEAEEHAGLEGSIVPRAEVPLALVRPVLEIEMPASDPEETDDLFAEPCEPKFWPGPTGVGSEGRFGWRDLRAGTAIFRLMLHGESEPLLVVPGIVLRAGETTQDPRIQRIPIDRPVLLHRIEVVGEEGEPVDGAIAIRIQPDGRCFAGFRKDASGEITIASLSPKIEVVVAAPDHRLARLPDLGVSARVVLRPALAVQVGLREGWRDLERLGLAISEEGAVSLILEPVRSELEIFGENPRASVLPPDTGLSGARDWFAEIHQVLTSDVTPAGEASFALPEPGRYRAMIRFEIVRAGEEHARPGRIAIASGDDPVEGPAEQTWIATLPIGGGIEVNDSSGLQRFDLQPDFAILERILEAMPVGR